MILLLSTKIRFFYKRNTLSVNPTCQGTNLELGTRVGPIILIPKFPAHWTADQKIISSHIRIAIVYNGTFLTVATNANWDTLFHGILPFTNKSIKCAEMTL